MGWGDEAERSLCRNGQTRGSVVRPGTASGLPDDSRGCLSRWVGDGGRGTGRVQLTNVLEGSLSFEKAVGGQVFKK